MSHIIWGENRREEKLKIDAIVNLNLVKELKFKAKIVRSRITVTVTVRFR